MAVGRLNPVARISSSDGRAILGRIVDAGDIAGICEEMGIDAPQLDANELIAGARAGGHMTITGPDTLTLKSTKIAGQERLELVGAFASRLSWYKAQGCTTDIIGYKTRLFVPHSTAQATIAAILDANNRTLAQAA